MSKRCPWAKTDDPNYVAYHDYEWGTPVHSDRSLFEFLILEGAQAGLSWSTILKKREHYRQAFDGFDPRIVARYGGEKIDQLLDDPGIVRNRLKVISAIDNARGFLRIQEEYGSFDRYVWRFVDGAPVQNHWKIQSDVPSKSSISDSLSKELKKRGFRFVGTTICYAFMQAIGMVNDHLVTCFRYRQLVDRGDTSP